MFWECIEKQREEKKIEFINNCKSIWIEKGQELKKQREEAGYGIKEIAKVLGISPQRVRRFEEGEPVQDAKLMERAYQLFLMCDVCGKNTLLNCN